MNLPLTVNRIPRRALLCLKTGVPAAQPSGRSQGLPFLNRIALVLALATCLSLHAQTTYIWTNALGGSWAAAANWSGSLVAAGSGNTANFSTLKLGTAPTVTLDGAQTIGHLLFGDLGNTYNWTLNTGSGGPLTLAVGSGTPTLTVNGQTSTISLVLAGTAGMTKGGAGHLFFRAETLTPAPPRSTPAI